MKRLLGAACLYGALALAMSWPLPLRVSDRMPIGPDNIHLAWALAWVAHATFHRLPDLFHGNIFYPARSAIAFSDPNVSSGILVSPLYALTGNPALLVNLLFLGSFVLCGLSAYLLAREWTGSHAGSLTAGLLFAFSPLRFTHYDHVQLYAFWWTPLALIGLDRFLRKGRGRDLALCSLAAILQAYASLYLASFTFAALLCLVLLGAESGRIAIRSTRLWVGGVAAAVAVMVVCLPLGYAYFSIQRTWGITRSLEQCVRYSASPLAYLSTVPENLLWGRVLAGFADPVAPWEKYLFPGIAPLILIGVAGLRERRSFAFRYGLVLAIVAAVLSLGPYLIWRGESTGWPLPYLAGYQWLFPLRALRSPSRWSLLATLGLATAASAGAARLGPRALLAIMALATAEAWVYPLPTWAAPSLREAPGVYRYLATSAKGPLIELPLASGELERSRLETRRLYYSTIHWRPIANGYSGYTPPSYLALADLLSGRPSDRMASFLAAWNIRTVVLHLDEMSTEQLDGWVGLAARAGLRTAFTESGIRVLELDDQEAARFERPTGRMIDRGKILLPGRKQPVSIRLETANSQVPVPPALFGWHSGDARWQPAGGKTIKRWVKYFCPPAIYDGMALPPLFFDTPPEGGAYRLEVSTPCFDLSGNLRLQGEGSSATRDEAR